MPTKRLNYLFDRYIADRCTPAEEKELAVLALAPDHEEEVKKVLGEYWDKLTEEMILPAKRSEDIITSILGKEGEIITKVRSIHYRWSAAAAIVLLIGVGSYFLLADRNKSKEGIVKTDVREKTIVAPTSSKATITLANGEKIYLDSAGNGQLALQGNTQLVKTGNGQIAYQLIKDLDAAPAINTLSNPRGSTPYNMMLSDGSQVWLNAGSSVTFPVTFSGNERKISITGEAYFEVAHDANKPFIVTKGVTEVRVLGTHFNVNSFDDETDIKVTLLEGSVRVTNGNSTHVLKPRQQALVAGTITVKDQVDLKAVMAWKDGFFNFKNADIKILMREIARWYDVEVVYEGATPKLRFGGEMPRSNNLSQVMEILKGSGVRFTMDERKVMIQQ